MALTSLDPPRVLAARDALVVAGSGLIAFAIWTGMPPTTEDVRTCVPALLEHIRRARRAALLVAVHPTVPLPSKEVRAAIQDEIAKLDPYLLCGATVIAREGFAGSALRAVTSTLQLLARPSHPEKIFATALEAATFVTSELRLAGLSCPTAVDLAAGYEELVRAHWRRAP